MLPANKDALDKLREVHLLTFEISQLQHKLVATTYGTNENQSRSDSSVGL